MKKYFLTFCLLLSNPIFSLIIVNGTNEKILFHGSCMDFTPDGPELYHGIIQSFSAYKMTDICYASFHCPPEAWPTRKNNWQFVEGFLKEIEIFIYKNGKFNFLDSEHPEHRLKFDLASFSLNQIDDLILYFWSIDLKSQKKELISPLNELILNSLSEVVIGYLEEKEYGIIQITSEEFKKTGIEIEVENEEQVKKTRCGKCVIL